jgi:hypothetical protein
MPGIITRNNKLLSGIILMMTSLICADATSAGGHPADFSDAAFTTLLTNAVFWALQKDKGTHSAPVPGHL